MVAAAIAHFAAMPPKLTTAEKSQRTRRATLVLKASADLKKIDEEREKLKVELQKRAIAKKKRAREIRRLKDKASKTNVADIMQMMMLKAYLMNEEKREAGDDASASASSTDEWRPKNPVEAFEKLQSLLGPSIEVDQLSGFAAELRSGSEPEA